MKFPVCQSGGRRRIALTGFLGLTTCLKGLKNSDSETPSGAKIAASVSTVTPLSLRSNPVHLVFASGTLILDTRGATRAVNARAIGSSRELERINYAGEKKRLVCLSYYGLFLTTYRLFSQSKNIHWRLPCSQFPFTTICCTAHRDTSACVFPASPRRLTGQLIINGGSWPIP